MAVICSPALINTNVMWGSGFQSPPPHPFSLCGSLFMRKDPLVVERGRPYIYT